MCGFVRWSLAICPSVCYAGLPLTADDGRVEDANTGRRDPGRGMPDDVGAGMPEDADVTAEGSADGRGGARREVAEEERDEDEAGRKRLDEGNNG